MKNLFSGLKTSRQNVAESSRTQLTEIIGQGTTGVTHPLNLIHLVGNTESSVVTTNGATDPLARMFAGDSSTDDDDFEPDVVSIKNKTSAHPLVAAAIASAAAKRDAIANPNHITLAVPAAVNTNNTNSVASAAPVIVTAAVVAPVVSSNTTSPTVVSAVPSPATNTNTTAVASIESDWKSSRSDTCTHNLSDPGQKDILPPVNGDGYATQHTHHHQVTGDVNSITVTLDVESKRYGFPIIERVIELKRHPLAKYFSDVAADNLDPVFGDEQIGDLIVLPSSFATEFIFCRGGWMHKATGEVFRTTYSFAFGYQFHSISKTFVWFTVVPRREGNCDDIFVRGTVAIPHEAIKSYLSQVLLKDDHLVAARRVKALYEKHSHEADSDVATAIVDYVEFFLTQRSGAVTALIADEKERFEHELQYALDHYPVKCIRGTCPGHKDIEIDDTGCIDAYDVVPCCPSQAPIMGQVLEDCNHKDVILNTTCKCSAVAAITNRVLRKTIKPSRAGLQGLFDFTDVLVERLFGKQILQKRYTTTQWLARQSAPKRRMYQNKLFRYRDQAILEGKDVINKAFIKREKFPGKAPDDFVPRLISQPLELNHVHTGPAIYSVEQMIKYTCSYHQRNPDYTAFENITYGSGMDRNVAGGWMSWVDQHFSHPLFVCTDYSKYDAHQSPGFLTVERKWYKACDPDTDWDSLLAAEIFTEAQCAYKTQVFDLRLGDQLRSLLTRYGNSFKNWGDTLYTKFIKLVLEWLQRVSNTKHPVKINLNPLHVRCYERITDFLAFIYKERGSRTVDEGIIRYACDGRKDSGRTNTAVGNFGSNVSVMLYALNRQFDIFANLDKWAIIATGDDSVLALNDINVDLDRFKRDITDIGIKVKIGTFAKHDVKFCSSFFVPCRVNGVDTYNLTQIPTTNMSKAYITCDTNLTHDQKLQWVYQNADNYTRLFNHIPFMREWHKKIRTNYEPTHAKLSALAQLDAPYLGVSVVPKHTAATYDWLIEHYRLTGGTRGLYALESLFKKKRVDWNNSIIQAMYQYDSLPDDNVDKVGMRRLALWPRIPNANPPRQRIQYIAVPTTTIKQMDHHGAEIEVFDDERRVKVVGGDDCDTNIGVTMFDLPVDTTVNESIKTSTYSADAKRWHFDRDTRQQICFTYRDTGSCRFGDDCRYRHPPYNKWFNDIESAPAGPSTADATANWCDQMRVVHAQNTHANSTAKPLTIVQSRAAVAKQVRASKQKTRNQQKNTRYKKKNAGVQAAKHVASAVAARPTRPPMRRNNNNNNNSNKNNA
jgi:hypothetical protein